MYPFILVYSCAFTDNTFLKFPESLIENSDKCLLIDTLADLILKKKCKTPKYKFTPSI